MVWTTKHVCVACAIWIYSQDRKYIYWIESKHRRNYAARLFSSLPQTFPMFPKCSWFFSNVLDCSRYALRDHFLTFVSRFILHQGSLYDNVWQLWNFWYLWVPHLPVIGKNSIYVSQIQCPDSDFYGPVLRGQGGAALGAYIWLESARSPRFVIFFLQRDKNIVCHIFHLRTFSKRHHDQVRSIVRIPRLHRQLMLWWVHDWLFRGHIPTVVCWPFANCYVLGDVVAM